MQPEGEHVHVDNQRGLELVLTLPQLIWRRTASGGTSQDGHSAGSRGRKNSLLEVESVADSGTSSSGLEAPERATVRLECDIYTHVLLTHLRKGMFHYDTLRGLLLLAVAVAAQIAIAILLCHRCWELVLTHEEDIKAARRHSGRSEFQEDGDVLQKICGAIPEQVMPLSNGYGSTFRMFGTWATYTVPLNKIGLLNTMLQWEYQVIFLLVVMTWMWRCAFEMRQIARIFRGLLFLETVTDHSSCLEKDKTTRIVTMSAITPATKHFAYWVVLLQVMVAILMTCSGYLLLATVERTVDLVVNALALEFIFRLDELIVPAMLEVKERSLIQSIQLTYYDPLLAYFSHSSSVGPVRYRRWRVLNCCRILVLAATTASFILPHFLKVFSLYTRAQVLCLTNGLTDGTDQLPDDVGAVIFPYRGFCETIVMAYASMDGTLSCSATKFELDKPAVSGVCNNTGDLRSAPWTDLMLIDQDVRRVCTEFWFGQGLPEGSKEVPALVRTEDDELVPSVFGCRPEDLIITTRDVWWPFFLSPATHSRVHCTHPAYGPRSRVWDSDSLTSTKFITPDFFFRFDKRSPIENQVEACKDLPSVHKETCGGDPCFGLNGGEAEDSESKVSSCGEFCSQHGLTCLEAYETTAHSTCEKTHRRMCYHRPGAGHDLLCRCGLIPRKRVCGRLPDVLARCDNDPCRVLVGWNHAVEGRRESCNEYCATIGLRCASQYRIRHRSCQRDLRVNYTCSDDLEPPENISASLWPARVCECKPW